MLKEDDLDCCADHNGIASAIIRRIEACACRPAPSELLHVASALIEHVAYSAAHTQSADETVELLGQALVTARAAERAGVQASSQRRLKLV